MRSCLSSCHYMPSPSQHTVDAVWHPQGTNAHVLLQLAVSVSNAAAHAPKPSHTSSCTWRRSYCYPAPAPNGLVSSAFRALSGQEAVFHVPLSGPMATARAAFLWQHQVNSRPLFPAAGYLEVGRTVSSCLALTRFCHMFYLVASQHPSIPASMAAPMVKP